MALKASWRGIREHVDVRRVELQHPRRPLAASRLLGFALMPSTVQAGFRRRGRASSAQGCVRPRLKDQGELTEQPGQGARRQSQRRAVQCAAALFVCSGPSDGRCAEIAVMESGPATGDPVPRNQGRFFVGGWAMDLLLDFAGPTPAPAPRCSLHRTTLDCHGEASCCPPAGTSRGAAARLAAVRSAETAVKQAAAMTLHRARPRP